MEGLNKMSKKIHSQDSNSDIEWTVDDCMKAFIDSAIEYDRIIKNETTECESEGKKFTEMG